MNVMVIDTETTGLPPRNADPREYMKYDACRVIEIAWHIYTSTGELLSEEEYVIKPDNFVIPDRSVQIHGITTDHALACGHSIETVVVKLQAALRDVSVIVAHNMAFDNGVVLAEMYRLKATNRLIEDTVVLDQWISKRKHCTMLMGQLPGQRWPKLVDLYTRLFNKTPAELLHRANADVRVCAEIYFELPRM